MVFLLNAVFFTMLIPATIVMCCGVTKPKCRCVGSYIMMILAAFNFFMLIHTGVHRFSIRGKLCALSQNPTAYYKGHDFGGNIEMETWTYEADAALMTAIWVLQLIFFCCCCFPRFNCWKLKYVYEEVS